MKLKLAIQFLEQADVFGFFLFFSGTLKVICKVIIIPVDSYSSKTRISQCN